MEEESSFMFCPHYCIGEHMNRDWKTMVHVCVCIHIHWNCVLCCICSYIPYTKVTIDHLLLGNIID